MKKNLYFLSFWLGLAAVLSGAVLLERLGLPLQRGNVTQVQAASLLEGAPSVPANSAGYSLDWFTLDGGGGLISGGSYSLISTVGQPDAGTSTNGGFTLEGGFWPGTLQPWHTYLPALRK
jgi:hypothetical protein